MKNIFTLIVVLLLPFFGWSQENNATVSIHTSAQCGICKKKIEHDMSFVKGVKSAVLNLKTRDLVIIYNPDKTNPEKLRWAVTKIGYDADTVGADPKAYESLLQCCKKNGHED